MRVALEDQFLLAHGSVVIWDFFKLVSRGRTIRGKVKQQREALAPFLKSGARVFGRKSQSKEDPFGAAAWSCLRVCFMRSW